MTLTVGSLFSGIGGLDLGLERAGMKVIWQSEIDPYACKVLSKHWPEVVNHGNIKEINWEEVERPNVICGGYPCQPFSTAGKRRGEEDPRHLWPWVREAISRLRPDYAILENVRGHLSMGGLSVIGELASIGYDAEWRVVSAASVGANHRRDRIIIVAYPQSKYGNECDNYTGDGSRPETLPKLGNSGGAKAMADTDNSGDGAPRCDIDGNWQAIEQGRQVISQSRSCRCSSAMANSYCCQPSDGRQCQALLGESGSRRNDGAGSRSDTRQISVGETGQDSSLMANTDSIGSHREKINSTNTGQYAQCEPARCSQDVADTNSGRCQQCQSESEQVSRLSSRSQSIPNSNTRQNGRGDRSLQQSARTVFNRPDNGRGTQEYAGWQWWETEPDVGRVANGVSSRVDRLRGLGNAVVPQVAEVIGRLVMEHAS